MHNGIKKSLLATQFESHYARNAFPCVDEPSAKAVFELTTKSPVGEVVLANMPMLEQTEVGGKLVTTFEKTPAMSTYLVAFVIGELQKKESQTKDGVTVAKEIELEDPIENMGAQMVKEVASKTSDVA